MSAKKIGIIAGGGELPEILYQHCIKNKIHTKVAALRCYANPNNLNNKDTKFFRIGQVGGILNYFKENNINEICLIGKVTRPNLFTVFPDKVGLKLMLKLFKVYKKGDNTLFERITDFIEEHNLKLVGVHKILPELLTKEGILGKTQPPANKRTDINNGFKKAKQIGLEDTGQAIIFSEGKVLAREDINGTNHMITEFGKNQTTGAILLKIKKPTQDERIDLPTIGIETIKLAKENGISGIVLEAGSSLIVNQQECINLADKFKIFIMGMKA